MKFKSELLLNLQTDDFDTGVPQGIEIINQAAFSGGKKFRPRLLMKVADCLGVSEQLAERYAGAAERIHNATLLHDDVIDESRSRRGKPTLNASGENRKSILAGDLLLARALRDLGAGPPTEVLQDLFDVLVEITEGEWLQLEARYRIDLEERHLYEVARKKTASLIGWCWGAPARLKGYTGATLSAFRGIGLHLGVAFQLLDDCLDFDSRSGKPFSQDLREGQINFVVRDLLERAPDLRDEVENHLLSRVEADAPLSFLNRLTPSLLAIHRKAEIEIEVAKALLKESDVHLEIRSRLTEEILEPFLIKIQQSLPGIS